MLSEPPTSTFEKVGFIVDSMQLCELLGRRANGEWYKEYCIKNV